MHHLVSGLVLPPSRELPRALGNWSAELIGVVLGLGLLLAVPGCGKDEKNPAPSLPPVLVVTGLWSVGGPEASADGCLELGRDPDGTVVVALSLEDLHFTLRPPGLCGKSPSCGYLAVLVDPAETGPALTVRAATHEVSVPLGQMDPGFGASEEHVLRIELRHQDDTAVLDSTGAPVALELSVSLRQPGGCNADGLDIEEPASQSEEAQTDKQDGTETAEPGGQLSSDEPASVETAEPEDQQTELDDLGAVAGTGAAAGTGNTESVPEQQSGAGAANATPGSGGVGAATGS